MKKKHISKWIRRVAVLVLIASMATALEMCRKIMDPPEEKPGDYVEVTFHPNEGVMSPQTQNVKRGKPVDSPDPSPVRQGYSFVNWYLDDESFIALYDFTTPVDARLDLYAKWKEGVPDSGGNPPAKEPDDSDPSSFDGIFQVSSADGWANVVAKINAEGEGKNYAIVISGDILLAGVSGQSANPPLQTFAPKGLAIVISNAGQNTHTLALESAGSLILVGNQQTIIIKDLALKGIAANSRALATVNGGGVLSLRGKAALLDNTNGSGDDCGGGVFVAGNGAFIMRDSAVVSGNTTTSREGGGVFVAGNGTFIMRDSAAVSGNATAYRDGGGVFVEPVGSFMMRDDAAVSGNRAVRNGGGVFDTGGAITIRDRAKVSGNKANRGGGVYAGGSGTVLMRDKAAVSGNEGGNNGGGVYVTDSVSLTMQDNAVVSGNEAGTSGGNGGGVYVVGSVIFTMRDNAVVSGNKAGGGGGVYSVGGVITMRGSALISGNTASTGGGVCLSDQNAVFTMRDSATVSGNTALGNGGGVYNSFGVFRIEGGVIYGGGEAGLGLAGRPLKNTAAGSGAALFAQSGASQRGTFDEEGVFTAAHDGTLVTTSDTIKVLAGELQS